MYRVTSIRRILYIYTYINNARIEFMFDFYWICTYLRASKTFAKYYYQYGNNSFLKKIHHDTLFRQQLLSLLDYRINCDHETIGNAKTNEFITSRSETFVSKTSTAVYSRLVVISIANRVTYMYFFSPRQELSKQSLTALTRRYNRDGVRRGLGD